MYRQKLGTASRTIIFFIIAASHVYVLAQDNNTCNQMCKEEREQCTKDCVMLRQRHEINQCEDQCSEDMFFCLDRCKNMVELAHAIPQRNISLVKSDTGHEKQQEVRTLVPNVFDINFVKLSSEKIFASHPPTTNIPPSTSVTAHKNQLEISENSKDCVAKCTSKESECEIECFIAYQANNFQDSDCTSRCQMDKRLCIENCESVKNEPITTEEDVAVVVPSQITNLRIPSQPLVSVSGTKSKSSSLEREISILRRILMGLPSSGTQMIGQWVR